jgi:hypothetical protein
MVELISAAFSTGAELSQKFASDPKTFELSFGGRAEFFEGLESFIGTANPKIDETMRKEHAEHADSDKDWGTANYGITITSYIEFQFVCDHECKDEKLENVWKKLGIFTWPVETKNLPDEERGRQPVSLVSFKDELNEKNDELKRINMTCLQLCELVGARLYTGPMFEKYSAVLRGGSLTAKQPPMPVDKFEQLCQGNRYPTTIHVLNSAVIKMSKRSSITTVHHDISNGRIPTLFSDFSEGGGVEFGFMSTTTN